MDTKKKKRNNTNLKPIVTEQEPGISQFGSFKTSCLPQQGKTFSK